MQVTKLFIMRFDGDGVTKYFDNDDNTVQQFTIALKLKEKAKTPDPVLPDPEVPAEPAKDPETPVEKVTRPEQPVKQNSCYPYSRKPVEKKATIIRKSYRKQVLKVMKLLLF